MSETNSESPTTPDRVHCMRCGWFGPEARLAFDPGTGDTKWPACGGTIEMEDADVTRT